MEIVVDSVQQERIFNQLSGKFETDVCDRISSENATGGFKLSEEGTLNIILRAEITSILNVAALQMSGSMQLQLLYNITKYFLSMKLYDFATIYYELSLTKCDAFDDIDQTERTKYKILAIQGLATTRKEEILSLTHNRIAPMAVSKLLQCLQILRQSLVIAFELPTRTQEEYAYQILNSCKLINDIGQPLVWLSCGKYVIESMMFASLCMETVINLCTTRHITLRMKLYTTAFYGALTQGGALAEEAGHILNHATKQVLELREREELDLPIPKKKEAQLLCSETDLAVMRFVLSFWKNPDSFSISNEALANFNFPDFDKVEIAEKLHHNGKPYLFTTFSDRCICECVRVQQLTAGNTNEVWKKRSSSLLKGFWTFFQNNNDNYFPTLAEIEEEKKALELENNKPAEEAAPVETKTPAKKGKAVVEVAQVKSIPKAKKKSGPVISISCLTEIITISMFDATEGTDINKIMEKIWGIVDAAPGPNDEPSPNRVEHQFGFDDLFLLRRLSSVIDSPEGNERLEKSLLLISFLDSILYSNHSSRRQSFLRRVIIGLWSKFVYPCLQKILTLDFSSASTLEGMQEIIPSITAIVRTLDISKIEDPILFGTISIITAQILNHVGESRSSISLLSQAIETIEEHRAARVDIHLHLPEDARDVTALQRQSFSARPTFQDWYHSTKRLGAHAFAGYGIFGAGSSADRSDQAVAEIHTDLLSLFFRYELKYSIKKRAAKIELKIVKEKAAAKEAKEHGAPASQPTATATLTGKSASITKMGTIGSGNNAENINQISAEKLSCIPVLKAFCGKNPYAKCILALEMIRVESNKSVRFQLFKDAKSYIDDAEASETVLQNAFSNLTVMNDSTPSYPIVLARSHKYIYIAPVGLKKLKKAQYYRVLGKEQGSGTDVSLTNDSFSGTEKAIQSHSLYSPSQCAVRIDPLRQGEKYVFGCVAFNENDKMVGSISPTTPPVEALNPLPIETLWFFLAQTAHSFKVGGACKFASNKICEKYFLNTPRHHPLVVGKGLNLFLDMEPSICMLAIKQSSPAMLYNFVSAFIMMETPAKIQGSGGSKEIKIHWNIRKEDHIKSLTSLRRVALVATIACYIKSHELALKCICLGYTIALELLEKDIVNLAAGLQGPLMSFLVALQSIPKRNWHIVEHQLYIRLFHDVIKVSIINRNTNPTLKLISIFLPELNDKGESKVSISSDVALEYSSLSSVTMIASGICSSENVMNDLKSLFSSPELDIDEKNMIWSLSAIQRYHLIRGNAVSLVNMTEKPVPELASLHKLLTEAPAAMSGLLSVLVQLTKEILSTPNLTNPAATLTKLFDVYPIYSDYLAPNVRSSNKNWKLSFVKSLPTKEELMAAKAAVAAAPPAKGKAPPPLSPRSLEAAKLAAEEADAALGKIPDIYVNVTAQEECLQFKLLGELSSVVASATFSNVNVKNNFPTAINGPLQDIDPLDTVVIENFNATLSEKGLDESQSKSQSPRTSTPASPRKEVLSLNKLNYVNHLLASIYFFQTSKNYASAVKAIVIMWNYLVDEWYDPSSFAIDFISLKKNIYTASVAMVTVIECLGGSNIVSGDNQDLGATIDDDIMSVASSVGFLDASMAFDQENVASENFDDDGTIVDFSKLRGTDSVCSDKENIYLCSNLNGFMIKVLWLFKRHNEVVNIGTRIMDIFVRKAPEFSKQIGELCFPFILHSQNELIIKATKGLEEQEKIRLDFVNDFEEYLKKKRKRKLRIARVEKDEDEIKFDIDKAKMDGNVNRAARELDFVKLGLDDLKTQKLKFETLNSTGVLLLDKVRESFKNFMVTCENNLNQQSIAFGDKSKKDEIKIVDNKQKNNFYDYRVCLGSREIEDKLDLLINQFKEVNNFLREKKDEITLIKCLKLYGDLLLLFGRISDARAVWLDAIDGLFGIMDACQNWEKCIEICNTSMTSRLIDAIVPAAIILGKLSKYCFPSDWDTKSKYCRLAAGLLRTLYSVSCGYPQTDIGFGAFVCRDLGGLGCFSTDSEKLSAHGIQIAFDEILSVLVYENHLIETLPIIVFLEYYHGYYTRHTNNWLSARILRIRVLIDKHLFAEAASMIASVKSTISSIINCNYDQPLLQENKLKTSQQFDTSSNGLDYYSLAPFFNHLPPHDDCNVKALEWIAEFPADFKVFSSKFVIQLPEKILTPEEQLEKERLAEAAAEAAALAAKGKKGKKEEAPVIEKPSNAIPLFDLFQETSLMKECAHFLLTVSCIDSRNSTGHASILQSFTIEGDKILDIANQNLSNICDPSSLRNSSWIDLYGQVQVLKIKSFIRRRDLKKARSLLMSIAQLLQSPDLCGGEGRARGIEGISGGTRCIISQLWFTIKDLLSEVAENQARYNDSVTMSTTSAKEASQLFCGYWLRAFLLRRATALFKLGKLQECQNDCDALFKQYELNVVTDLGLVRALLLKASALRETMFISNSSHCKDILLKCIDYARKSRDLADILAKKCDFLGSDCNITYSRADTMIQKHHLLSPLLHNLTDIHPNVPLLTIPIDSDSKAIVRVTKNATSPKNVLGSKITPLEKQGLRLGPVDSADSIYSKSEFANIYLEEVRISANCQGALCNLLDEARCSGATSNDEVILKEQIFVGETALKSLRHVVYASSILRVSLLLSVGKTRVVSCQNSPSLTKTGDLYLDVFRAALDVSISKTNFSHPWTMMKTICIQFVEAYGDKTLTIGSNDDDENGAERLRMASLFLLTAIKVSNQYSLLTNNSITLASNPEFSASIPPQLLSMLTSLSSSSASLAKSDNIVPVAAVDPKAKAKAPAKGEVPTDSGPNGRDSIFLLNSFLRETNSLWLDCYESNIAIDLHAAMLKAYPAYAINCVLDTIPTLESQLNVSLSSISSLYSPVRTPKGFKHPLLKTPEELDAISLYSHVSSYFLFGPKQNVAAAPVAVDPKAKGKTAAPAPVTATPDANAQPILTKIVLFRQDLKWLEDELRDLYDKLVDGTIKGTNNAEKEADMAARLGHLIRVMVGLLNNGFIIDRELTGLNGKNGELSERGSSLGGSVNGELAFGSLEDRSPTTEVVVNVNDGGSISVLVRIGEVECIVPFRKTCIKNLADILCNTKDTNSLIENNLCILLRTAFGYVE